MEKIPVPLTSLSEEQRAQASARSEIVHPAPEDGISQAQIARTHQLAKNTVQRRIARYREQELAGLTTTAQKDKGISRRLPAQAMPIVEELALQTPQRSASAIHHEAAQIANEQGWKPLVMSAFALCWRRRSGLISYLIVSRNGEGNSMILEGFFAGLIGNIFKDLVVQVITRKWTRVDEKEVEKIVAAYLAQHHTLGNTATLTREVIIIMGTSGLLGSNGQIVLPSSPTLSDPNLIVSWLEKQYLNGIKTRLGSPTSQELEAWPSQRGTRGRVQRFTGSQHDPIGASVYWSQLYGAYPTWGWIARCYEKLGGTGSRLGFPTSLEIKAWPSQRGTTGQVQRFEGGQEDSSLISIYCSPHSAYPTWGWIAQCYERLGGTGSRLGFPISSEYPASPSPQETAGQVQRFEGGPEDSSLVSIYCSRFGAYPVWGEMARRYESLGGTTSSFGFPTSPEQEVGHGAWIQHFEGGDLRI